MRKLTPAIALTLFFSGTTALAADTPTPFDPPVNHPHWYASPAAITGYTLAQGEFEIQALLNPSPISYYLQKNTAWNLFSLGAVRYGIFDSLTADVEAGPWSAQASLRWQFATSGRWSFAIQPLAAFQIFSYSSSIGTAQSGNQEILSLGASYEVDPRNHVHLSLEGGDNAQNENYPNGIVIYSSSGSSPTYSDYQANRTAYGGRFTAEYEHRFNYRHGMSFWLAALLQHSHEADGLGFVSDSTELDFIPAAGMSYLYTRENFWFLTGMELGPLCVLNSVTQYPASDSLAGSTYYSNTGVRSLAGTLNLTVGWRL